MTKDQRKLFDRSRDFLRAAERDLRAEDWSMVVSRAYYAVFHAATAALHSRNVEARSHAGTLRQFSKHFVNEGPLPREAGKTYAKLMQAREEADYATDPSITESEARRYMDEAEELIDEIHHLLG